MHHHGKSIIDQREIGFDTHSFEDGLRAALRQDPDVILVGEMRDLETISTAITAAETGHLVLATLHTWSAASTIDRIIDVFPHGQQSQIRVQLAGVLTSVISQRLFQTADRQGRRAATELMINNPAIANLIRTEKVYQIPSVIQTNRAMGMHMMETSVREFLNQGIISYDTARPHLEGDTLTMARFKYEGRDAKSVRRGVIVATDKRDAAMKLKSQGIRVMNLTEQAETVLTKEIVIGKPVKQDQFIMFLQQFSALLRAGVTINDAIRVLAMQVESKPFRKILGEVSDELRGGGSLSEALAKHPKAFEPLTINLIRAGEISGTIDDSLDRLAVHYEKSYLLKQKVISALSYPIIVAIVAVAVVIYLLTMVVPMFIGLFDSVGEELPLLTRFVIRTSDFAIHYWYLFVFFAGLVVLGIWMLRRNRNGKLLLDTFLLKIPLFGKIMQKAVLATMTRTLSSLFSSSVPILQALTMTERVVENEVISRVITQSKESLEEVAH